MVLNDAGVRLLNWHTIVCQTGIYDANVTIQIGYGVRESTYCLHFILLSSLCRYSLHLQHEN